MRPIFLTAEWRNLLMLNYLVEPSVLEPLVPGGTELDDLAGANYISLVAFSFLNTRVKGVPIPFHRNFAEVNLRFYVRVPGPEGVRRGVVFCREVVPRRAIAWVARRLYNENYVACPMRSSAQAPSGDVPGSVDYRWRHRGKWLTLGTTISGLPELPAGNSAAEFITEHYWGYSTQRDGGTVEYQVEHPQWRVWQAESCMADGDFAAFYGPEFASVLSRQPVSAFVAEGSPVVVRSGSRLAES